MPFSNLALVVRSVAVNPLARRRPLGVLARYLRWQLGSRLLGQPIAMPFIGPVRLLVSPGMHGATLNLYAGLADFPEMAFLLHFLRPGEHFADVGANVGAYSLLAAGVAGAEVHAFEPGAAARSHLEANVRLNGLAGRVRIHAEVVGETPGTVSFQVDQDTLNRVVVGAPSGAGCAELPQARLDDALDGARPILLKVDTEGYEEAVLKGAPATLSSLQAALLEITGCLGDYGASVEALWGILGDAGFGCVSYDPFTRSLAPLSREEWLEQGVVNALFVKDLAAARERVRTAPPFVALGITV